jgi:hypothetical protein
MANRRTGYRRRKLSDEEIADDIAFLRALEQLEGYQPADPACSVAALQKLEADMLAASEAEALALQALTQARAEHDAAVLALGAAMRASGRNVVVQCGNNGYTVQVVELILPADLIRREDRTPPAQRVLAA